MIRVMRDQNGSMELALLLIMIIMTLGVLGFDLSHASSVRARIQTAADAASLAAVSQATVKMMTTEKMYDASGRETTDPNQAVKIVATVTSAWPSIDPDKANAAAVAAYVKNLKGEMVPLSNVAAANAPGMSGGKVIPSSYYTFDTTTGPAKLAPDGSTYYDTYAVSKATAGVRAFLVGRMMRKDASGNDVLSPLNQPNQYWPGRTVPLKVRSTAQVLVGY